MCRLKLRTKFGGLACETTITHTELFSCNSKTPPAIKDLYLCCLVCVCVSSRAMCFSSHTATRTEMGGSGEQTRVSENTRRSHFPVFISLQPLQLASCSITLKGRGKRETPKNISLKCFKNHFYICIF